MLKFTEYQQLDEKQILYNQGKRYGQVVFVVGGAGSGKGFAISNFLQKEKFKVRDVDEWKSALMKLDQIAKDVANAHKQKGIDTTKLFGVSASELKLNNPRDVFALHGMVDELKWKNKTLDLLLHGAKSIETLPNIIFDITFKDKPSAYDAMHKLIAFGYKPENIHMVWVLTDYQIAIERNASRDRIVPTDILFHTHTEAARNMIDVIKGEIPKVLNGRIDIILNNKKNTIFWTRHGKPILTGKNKQPVIKSFTYIQLKREGQKVMKDSAIQKEIFDWIKANVPAEVFSNKKYEYRG